MTKLVERLEAKAGYAHERVSRAKRALKFKITRREDRGAGIAGTGKFKQKGMSHMNVRVVEVSSSDAKNRFGRVLDQVANNTTVIIKKHEIAQAVMMSVERYEALTRPESSMLDALTSEFDTLLASMQKSKVRAAARSLFDALPEELGRAAVVAAQRNDD